MILVSIVWFYFIFLVLKLIFTFLGLIILRKKKVLIKTIKIITSELYKTRIPTDSETQVHH